VPGLHAASEAELIERAQQALSQSAWVVGECASAWTKRYARGRTDADFGQLIGLSADQVYQRRRVWETFADVSAQFPNLKWSHFYAALTWDDAAECLQWAEENQATLAEMRAWRRAQRGEDLAQPSADEPPPWVELHAGEMVPVRDPAEFGTEGERSGGARASPRGADEEDAVLAGVARGIEPGDGYAPFKQGATKLPEGEGSTPAVLAPPSPEQLARRLAGTLERMTRAITPEFAAALPGVPEKVRERLKRALKAFETSAKALK
jgi:hypothetical protein